MNGEPPAAGRGTPVWRNPFVLAFGIGIAVLTLLRFTGLLEFTPDAPRPIAQVGPFELVAANGEPFGSAQLNGLTYVAGFFFVGEPADEGAPIQAMRALQERYRAAGVEGVHLVSVTVDPGRDTPDRLASFAADIGADPVRWTLLTGEPERVRTVVEQGFRGAMGPGIARSSKLVLVDDKGRIRGYYGTDELGLDELFHRSQHVRDQPF